MEGAEALRALLRTECRRGGDARDASYYAKRTDLVNRLFSLNDAFFDYAESIVTARDGVFISDISILKSLADAAISEARIEKGGAR